MSAWQFFAEHRAEILQATANHLYLVLVAMAFAIAALAAQGPSRIEGAEVVSISYPGFFETLDRLVA